MASKSSKKNDTIKENYSQNLSLIGAQISHPIMYFFGYKTEVSFQNNPKNLGPSYKMDLDPWDC